MPRIRLILEDDHSQQIEQTFALTGDLDSLDGIDEAVEQFRLNALPDLEKALLVQAQERTLQEKKTVPGA
jgi:hypothetical protein